MTPEPWEFVLLALAAFRVWKLIADDRILDRPRDWLINRISRKRGSPKAVYWQDFLICPWCAGFWISLVTYSAWIAVGPGTWDTDELLMGGVSVFAISAVVGSLGLAYYALVADE